MEQTKHYSHPEIASFAETNFRGLRRRFGIKTDDRRRHVYVVGKTGMGKSTLLENMIVADMRAGRGVCVVDPHGDLVEKVIEYVPTERINDVVYFNPADLDWPIGFNVLESVESKYKHLIASGLMAVFTKIWAGVWSARMEYILNNCILALLDYPGSTMLGINRLLVDREFRQKVLTKIEDPVVKAFWIDEYEAYNDKFRTEAIAPIQNKVGQFLSSGLIRNIVGQPKSTINLRELMDQGKIVLLNLSKGRLGENNAALLGAMMITRIQLAAMSRIDVLEVERRDFYLYVDEFQNFATTSFANILSEARKYRLALIIAHQYIEQLDEDVQPAVFGNVGTIITFRVGANDAEYLEKEFGPRFMATDIVNLPKFQMYLKLMIDGVASDPFSAVGLPPLTGEEKTGNLEKIIRVSRERYARPRESVEEKIMRWSGVEQMFKGAAEGENIASQNMEVQYREGSKQRVSRIPQEGYVRKPEIRNQKSQSRPIHRMGAPKPEIRNRNEQWQKPRVRTEAVCTFCGAKTVVNFVPDPAKPLYCDTCWQKKREGRLGIESVSPNHIQLTPATLPVQNKPFSLKELKERKEQSPSPPVI